MTLGAPISIAQQVGDDTLTYLNKGGLLLFKGETRSGSHSSFQQVLSYFGKICHSCGVTCRANICTPESAIHSLAPWQRSNLSHTHTHTHTHIHTHTGQFYNLYVKANSSMSMPEQVKSMIFLNFFDEPDHKVEFSHWQYWYNLQANPNQKAFDIGG